MSGRAQGRGRQSRRERPQRNRGRDNSADSVNSTTSTRGERERRERSNGRNYKRRPEKRDERSRKSDEKPRENADKPSSRSSAAERRDADRSGKRPEKLALSPRDRIEPSSRENLELSRDGSVKGPTNGRSSCWYYSVGLLMVLLLRQFYLFISFTLRSQNNWNTHCCWSLRQPRAFALPLCFPRFSQVVWNWCANFASSKSFNARYLYSWLS